MSVTIEWTENSRGVRANSKPKKSNETKPTQQSYPVTDLTRVALITAALTAHGYQSRYVPGVASGPAFKIYWSGSP
jgi:hypothetical protein